MKAIIAFFVVILSCGAEAGTLRIMNYNVANNPDNEIEDASFRAVFEAVGAENVSGTAKRIDLLAVSETDTSSSARLANILNDLYGVSTYQVIISSPDGGNDRTGLVYDASRLILLDHVVLDSGLTHHALRAMFGIVGADRIDDLFVYAIHLKSGATSSDKTARANEMQIIRDDADNLGINANVIYAGDFNMHGSSEGAWTNMVAPGDSQGFDAANALGEWRDNPAFKILHTQDPRGNMDDRFDFQFVSGELLDDVGLDFIDGSYRVFGNDGTHLMGDAISTGTGATPQVLDALEDNSDHLPVVVNYHVQQIWLSRTMSDTKMVRRQCWLQRLVFAPAGLWWSRWALLSDITRRRLCSHQSSELSLAVCSE